jgi:precorrin-6x reductase
MGLEVILISPPALPVGVEEVDTVEAAIAWVDRQ